MSDPSLTRVRSAVRRVRAAAGQLAAAREELAEAVAAARAAGRTLAEIGAAAGGLYDAVVEGRLVHLGQHNLTAAVRGATKRPLGGAWAWNRTTSAVDITPLVAATLALAAYQDETSARPKPPPRVINLAALDRL